MMRSASIVFAFLPVATLATGAQAPSDCASQVTISTDSKHPQKHVAGTYQKTDDVVTDTTQGNQQYPVYRFKLPDGKFLALVWNIQYQDWEVVTYDDWKATGNVVPFTYANGETDPAPCKINNLVCPETKEDDKSCLWRDNYGGLDYKVEVTPVLSDTSSTISGDPHLHFAHGGVADFRGNNDTYYNLLSTPGHSFAARSTDSDFLLPNPLLFVHGTFFTHVSWVLRGLSDRLYGIFSYAGDLGFKVVDMLTGIVLRVVTGVWQKWQDDGVFVLYKQSTLYVRANGWEVNATRKPIYNRVSGPSLWRYDIAMRPLDGTASEAEFGTSSKTCFPHGLVGQSFDGDAVGVSGATDDYKSNSSAAVFTTKAMAEGAIEGSGDEYALKGPYDTEFKYSRFKKQKGDKCAARDVSKLAGKKSAAGGKLGAIAAATETSNTEIVEEVESAPLA